MKYAKGDKVLVVANESVPDLGGTSHYFQIGEIVRVTHVSRNLIFCRNSEGLEQALRARHIEPIKNQQENT